MDAATQALNEALLQQLSYITTHTSATAEQLATGVTNHVLEVASAVLDTSGAKGCSWQATCGAIAVFNTGDYPVLVASGMPGVAPVQGPGMSSIGANEWRIVNINSRYLTLYGTAGQRVDYQAFTTGLPPAGGQLGAAAITAATVTATGLVAGPVTTGGARRYQGFSLRETSGSAGATVRVYNGVSAAGVLLDTISLLANESAREDYGGRGLLAPLGIYFELVAGAVEGSVRYS
jgi:hypothetical protein